MLGKAPSGEETLGQLFDTHGQALRHNTKLRDAKFYSADFERTGFINLYPFLPAHFDILLNLLGALAKSTGGIGLRSAIKVIQDILIEEHNEQPPVAERPIGWLATTVTLYDALQKDIQRAFPSIHYAAENTSKFYSDSSLHQDVAKSIAVLQILGNLPVTVENLASLMHPSVEADSRLDDIQRVVDEMLQEPQVPLTDKDGTLHFLSEKLRDIDVERSRLIPRKVDVRSNFNAALRDCFDPLPRATLLGSLQVRAGIKVLSGNTIQSLAGDQYPIQIQAQFVQATEYDDVRSATVEESRQRQSQNIIYILGRIDPDAQTLAEEIAKCEQIEETYRNDPDQEVRDYCKNQLDRANRLKGILKQKLEQSLCQGSFVARGNMTAVSALDSTLLEAARKQLDDIAEQVFNRYSEAPTRAETSLAEKFLKQTNLSAITDQIDPLNFVQSIGGQLQIQTNQKAIVSIRDYVERNGTVEGKRLMDHFSAPPFGWSPDTLRYILAAMLVAGEITLKISGKEVKTVGQQAIDALKTNKSFGKIGVALRDYRPSLDVVARASERMTALIGETIIPLEQEIAKAAIKVFPGYQRDYSPLSEKLAALSLAGVDRVRSLNSELADVLQTDASDVTERLGGEESALYENLKWAGDVKRSLDNGLGETVQEIQSYRQTIQTLPRSGIPGTLQQEVADELDWLEQRLNKDDFYGHAADFHTKLTTIKNRVQEAMSALAEQQKQRVKEAVEDLVRLPDWGELTEEEKNNIRAQLEQLLTASPKGLSGIQNLLGREYSLNTMISQQKERIRQTAQNRRQQRQKEKAAPMNTAIDVVCIRQSFSIPARVTSVEQLRRVIQQLQDLSDSLNTYSEIDVSIEIQE